MNILRYREQLIDWMAEINVAFGHGSVAGVCIGVREGHIIKKLRDKKGVWLCANYPDYVLSCDEDNRSDRRGVLLYLVEKVPSGSQSEEDEITHYAKMEKLMGYLCQLVMEGPISCEAFANISTLNVEWEYDVFGGWNGLSVSFKTEEFYDD